MEKFMKFLFQILICASSIFLYILQLKQYTAMEWMQKQMGGFSHLY